VERGASFVGRRSSGFAQTVEARAFSCVTLLDSRSSHGSANPSTTTRSSTPFALLALAATALGIGLGLFAIILLLAGCALFIGEALSLLSGVRASAQVLYAATGLIEVTAAGVLLRRERVDKVTIAIVVGTLLAAFVPQFQLVLHRRRAE